MLHPLLPLSVYIVYLDWKVFRAGTLSYYGQIYTASGRYNSQVLGGKPKAVCHHSHSAIFRC